MQIEGKKLRRRLKNAIGITITPEEYAEWTAASDRKGRLNFRSNPETRKLVIDAEDHLRQVLISKLPLIDQVQFLMSNTNDLAVDISDTLVVQTDMNIQTRGHLGKGTEGVNSVFMKI